MFKDGQESGVTRKELLAFKYAVEAEEDMLDQIVSCTPSIFVFSPLSDFVIPQIFYVIQVYGAK